jgi:hypothetical protein
MQPDKILDPKKMGGRGVLEGAGLRFIGQP